MNLFISANISRYSPQSSVTKEAEHGEDNKEDASLSHHCFANGVVWVIDPSFWRRFASASAFSSVPCASSLRIPERGRDFVRHQRSSPIKYVLHRERLSQVHQ